MNRVKPNNAAHKAELKKLLQPIGKLEHALKLDCTQAVVRSFQQNVWPAMVCTLMWVFGCWLSLLGLWQADWLLAPFGLLVFGLMTVLLYRLLPQLYSAPTLFVGDKGLLWVVQESTGRVLAHQLLLYSGQLVSQQTALKGQTKLQIEDSLTGQSIVFTAADTDADASALLKAAYLQSNAKAEWAKRQAAKQTSSVKPDGTKENA